MVDDVIEQTTLELTRKSTRLIGLLDAVTEAVIVTVDLRVTVELLAGFVMETTGGGGPATVMLTGADVAEFPALSVATA